MNRRTTAKPGLTGLGVVTAKCPATPRGGGRGALAALFCCENTSSTADRSFGGWTVTALTRICTGAVLLAAGASGGVAGFFVVVRVVVVGFVVAGVVDDVLVVVFVVAVLVVEVFFVVFVDVVVEVNVVCSNGGRSEVSSIFQAMVVSSMYCT